MEKQMPEFEKYVERYGEVTVQNLIERMERYAGIKGKAHLSLEERWVAVMKTSLQVGEERLAA